MITIERYHDISCGHRVVGHEGKCVGIHGHNYRITFTCAMQPERPRELDSLGRVIDFGVVKAKLCQWLEDNWDHKMLLWKDDPFIAALYIGAGWLGRRDQALEADQLRGSVFAVSFNPTAENMAHHLLTVVAPEQMKGTGVEVIMVKVEETRKCSAVAAL